MITMKVRGAINPRIRSLDQLFELQREAAMAAVVAGDRVFRAQEKALFESEGSSGGEKWAPLSKAYERRKAAVFASAQLQTVSTMRSRGKKVTRKGIAAALGTEFKILQFTGDMRRAFSTAGRGHVARTSKTARGWITMFGAEGSAYFAIHAQGGKVPNRPPIRNPLLATEAQWDQRLSAMEKALIPFVMRSYHAMTAWRGLRSNL